MIGITLTWFAFWMQWAVFAANIWLAWQIGRRLKENRKHLAWMDEQIKAAERENEVLGDLVALYLAFHYKGLYW